MRLGSVSLDILVQQDGFGIFGQIELIKSSKNYRTKQDDMLVTEGTVLVNVWSATEVKSKNYIETVYAISCNIYATHVCHRNG